MPKIDLSIVSFVCLYKRDKMLFFTKKYFIADLLEGLTDMHCHILPNIDDGSKDNAMSLEMLKQYSELGYTSVIATPHIMNGFYDNTAVGITEAFIEFQSFIAENGYKNFVTSAAAEYMIDGGFDDLIEKKEFLPVTGNKVLVEMSYLQPPFNVTEQLFQLQLKGFEPILAHPERYPYLSNIASVLEFKNKGCRLQLNLLSLGGHYGKDATRQAFSLLENGHFDYLATDAHHPGHFNVLKRITIPKKTLEYFESLVVRTNENLIS